MSLSTKAELKNGIGDETVVFAKKQENEDERIGHFLNEGEEGGDHGEEESKGGQSRGGIEDAVCKGSP